MSGCGHNENGYGYAVYSLTACDPYLPVRRSFIRYVMPTLSESAVKVYFYLLDQCYDRVMIEGQPQWAFVSRGASERTVATALRMSRVSASKGLAELQDRILISQVVPGTRTDAAVYRVRLDIEVRVHPGDGDRVEVVPTGTTATTIPVTPGLVANPSRAVDLIPLAPAGDDPGAPQGGSEFDPPPDEGGSEFDPPLDTGGSNSDPLNAAGGSKPDPQVDQNLIHLIKEEKEEEENPPPKRRPVVVVVQPRDRTPGGMGYSLPADEPTPDEFPPTARYAAPTPKLLAGLPPAVALYWSATGFYPGTYNAGLITKALGAEPTEADEKALKSAVELWRGSGFKVDNIVGILEWYEEIKRSPKWRPGDRFRTSGNGRAAQKKSTTAPAVAPIEAVDGLY